MTRSLNKVQLIGNLTRDPELRYTPQGSAVCSFGLATNRQWTTESGEKKDEADFHRIVAWNKLAEICAQLLKKGRKTYVEGRLQTRNWTGQDGAQRTTTEVVISDMIVLDSKFSGSDHGGADFDIPGDLGEESQIEEPAGDKQTKPTKATPKAPAKQTKSKPTVKAEKVEKKEDDKEEKDTSEDIPF